MEQHSSLIPPETPGKPRPGIIVADDDPAVRRLLDMAFRNEGFQVWLASNGEEVLEWYRSHHSVISLVLLDVEMPTLDGLQTLRALRILNPELLCYFMTGGSRYHMEELLTAGPLAVFPKPLRVIEMTRILWQRALEPTAAGCFRPVVPGG